MEITKLNKKYEEKIKGILNVYVTLLKANRLFEEELSEIEKKFFNGTHNVSTLNVEVIKEEFKISISSLLTFFKIIDISLKEASKRHSEFNNLSYLVVTKNSDKETLFALLRGNSADIVFLDNLIFRETGKVDNEDKVVIRNSMFNISCYSLRDAANNIIHAIEKELGISPNRMAEPEVESLNSIMNAMDDYDLREVIRQHNIGDVVHILKDIYDSKIHSLSKPSIIGFVDNLIPSADAYNQLHNVEPISKLDIRIDVIKQMVYIILAIRHYLNSKDRIAKLDNSRAIEYLLNIQKESAGIRFKNEEILFNGNFEDFTVSEESMITIEDKKIYFRVEPSSYDGEEKAKHLSSIYLEVANGHTLNFNRPDDIAKIKEVLTSEEMTAFIGRLAIELYLEIYKLSNEYRDKYTKSFKTLRDDTVTKFYTTGELLVINDIDLNKLEEMVIRNKMLDMAIDRLGNNQNLFGSTSDGGRKKELAVIATMTAAYIGDLRNGSKQ